MLIVRHHHVAVDEEGEGHEDKYQCRLKHLLVDLEVRTVQAVTFQFLDEDLHLGLRLGIVFILILLETELAELAQFFALLFIIFTIRVLLALRLLLGVLLVGVDLNLDLLLLLGLGVSLLLLL